jgi:hypothetical protein
MIQFNNQEIKDERLVLDSKTELYYLGHDLTLRNCTLVVKVPARALVIARARFVDCMVEVTRFLRNFQWDAVQLKGCRFIGRFRGNDFGNWPDGQWEGSIEDCDFSGAHLDECRFLGCDVRTIRFPSWPYFTILDPARRWREFSTAPWPGSIGRIEVKCFAEESPATVAVTFSAPELAKRSGTTPEAIKAVLTKLDGVVY